MQEEEIERLVDRFERSSLDHLQITDDNFKLVLSKPGAAPAPVSTPPTSSGPVAEPATADGGRLPVSANTTSVTAPLVGVVYFAPQPDQPVFKQVGDPVAAGDVVCLIEAMKMVNEVKAPVDGVLKAVLVDDGTLVEYDQPLMQIEQA